jgi:hypothetical protein
MCDDRGLQNHKYEETVGGGNLHISYLDCCVCILDEFEIVL